MAFAPRTGDAGTPARCSGRHWSSLAAGVGRVLLTCDDGNEASASIIVRAAGVLEEIRVAPDGIGKRRYWIG